jgi:hypothetical protein
MSPDIPPPKQLHMHVVEREPLAMVYLEWLIQHEDARASTC